MGLPLIPAWVPNVHPLIIHFPIVLVVLASMVDLSQLVRPRADLSRLATALWVLGALSAAAAFLSGRSAAQLVYIPGMAHGLVDDHWTWAMVTTGVLVVVATLRLVSSVTRTAETRTVRLLYAAAALAMVVLVQQTAERGARLVYEQGVGVIPGAMPDATGDSDRGRALAPR
jgi:uncharacterized membrane protein